MSRLLLAFVFAGWAACVAAALTTREGPGIYDPDPKHLWNRLHEAAFVRIGPDGREYGRDRIEPLLWRSTKHLLEGASHDELLKALAAFNRGGDRLITDPVKRAMLQRDLWMVFTWLEHGHDGFYGFGGNPADWQARCERLRQPLASAIARLALTPSEVGSLPDNYAAAVSSGAFAPRFDAAQPEKPFLPDDLFAADGGWVSLGRGADLIAPTHVVADNPFTTSAFLIFVKLPGGRQATLDYLSSLWTFAKPVLSGDYPNYHPALPQFPAGTQVALVRRALIVTAAHDVAPGPLTEMVQLRVYREVPPVIDFLRATLVDARVRSQQAKFEFVLGRRALFAGRAGGLQHSADVDDGILTGFSTHGIDAFEPFRDQGTPTMTAARQRPASSAPIEKCVTCHTLPGVYSLGAVAFDTGRRPPNVAPAPVGDVLATGAAWKRMQPDWALLKRLMSAGVRAGQAPARWPRSR